MSNIYKLIIFGLFFIMILIYNLIKVGGALFTPARRGGPLSPSLYRTRAAFAHLLVLLWRRASLLPVCRTVPLRWRPVSPPPPG